MLADQIEDFRLPYTRAGRGFQCAWLFPGEGVPGKAERIALESSHPVCDALGCCHEYILRHVAHQ